MKTLLVRGPDQPTRSKLACRRGTSTLLNQLLSVAGQSPGNTRVYAIHRNGNANPGGSYEIRPLLVFRPGTLAQ